MELGFWRAARASNITGVQAVLWSPWLGLGEKPQKLTISWGFGLHKSQKISLKFGKTLGIQELKFTQNSLCIYKKLSSDECWKLPKSPVKGGKIQPLSFSHSNIFLTLIQHSMSLQRTAIILICKLFKSLISKLNR